MKYTVMLPGSRMHALLEILEDKEPRPALWMRALESAKLWTLKALAAIGVIVVCCTVLAVGRFIVMSLEGNI